MKIQIYSKWNSIINQWDSIKNHKKIIIWMVNSNNIQKYTISPIRNGSKKSSNQSNKDSKFEISRQIQWNNDSNFMRWNLRIIWKSNLGQI